MPADSNATVLVNGKASKAGTETSETRNGQVHTVIAMQEELLKPLLAQEKGEGTEIAIVFEKKADVWTVELNDTLIREMASRKAALRMEAGGASYLVPAEQLAKNAELQSLSEQAGAGKVRIRLEIGLPDAAKTEQIKQTAAKGGYTFVIPPVSFRTLYMAGERNGELERFGAYVERTILLPDSATESGKVTGLVIAANGSIGPVPARMSAIGGKKAVVIRSMAGSGIFAVVNASAAAFADTDRHWALEAIRDLGSRGMISGTGEGVFEPDRSMTRAEFAAIAVKALGLPGRGRETGSRFSDVDAAAWYTPYIQTAYEYGLISGHEDGSFGPQRTISREQAITIIGRAMDLTGLRMHVTDEETQRLLASFADAERIAGYARTGIAEGVKAGLVSGKGENTFAPADPMTRAEVATIVQRLLHRSGLID
jgi:hypothetical protein